MQVASVGADGAIGASLDGPGLPVNSNWIVQLPGKALRVRSADFHAAARRREPLMRLALQAETGLVVSLMWNAACNGLHSLEQRLCRALHEACEHSADEHVPLTQAFLSQILGVQRTTVSMVVQDLQNDGLIQYRRGAITVLDKERLAERACDCRLTLRRHLATMTARPVSLESGAGPPNG